MNGEKHAKEGGRREKGQRRGLKMVYSNAEGEVKRGERGREQAWEKEGDEGMHIIG